MIRKNQIFLNHINIFLDILIVLLSYVFSSWLYLDFFDGDLENIASISLKTILLAAAYSLMLFFILSMFGFYNTTRTRRLLWKIRTIIFSVTISTLITVALFFIFRLAEFSRGVIFVFYITTILLLVSKYAFMRKILRHFRERGYNLKHIIIIGTGKLARQYSEDLKEDAGLGFHIKGYIGKQDNDGISGQYLGSFEVIDTTLSSPDINEVVIALDPEEYEQIQSIIPICERNGVKYSVIPFYNDMIPAHPFIETIGRCKLINMRVNRLENLGWSILKRIFDIMASILGILLLSPLFLIIAIGVKRSSPGPILFRQTRVGFQRKEFQIIKFRSMRQNDAENTAWTTAADLRKTRFGALIRKLSLDELPQLFNVLKGEMSLVGPRPELPYFVEQFKEKIPFYMVKYQVRPGITGWAQIHGYRGDTSIEKRVELDLWYIDHWSIWLDFKILLKTVFGGMINREKQSAS